MTGGRKIWLKLSARSHGIGQLGLQLISLKSFANMCRHLVLKGSLNDKNVSSQSRLKIVIGTVGPTNVLDAINYEPDISIAGKLIAMHADRG